MDSNRWLNLLVSAVVAGVVVFGEGGDALAGGRVTAARSEITLPTYPWWPAVKHPYFRGTDGVNIYPYPMLDNLSRQKALRTYRTVVLENEFLRITFLPELGGKIHEVLDKTTGQPMFYVNHVVKPGLIGQCGAWTSGGVEWNTGPQGHTVSAMQPVDVEILPAELDGSRSVAIGETERVYGTKWTVAVTLRPGRSFIEERIRIYNPTVTVRPYYFWNCTAVPNTPGFRFIYPMTLGSDHSSVKFFTWPIDHGKDLSRGTNYEDASSIFAWNCDQDFFGSYDEGADRGVVAYANHHQLPGKKAWTWGHGSFGRMHQMDLTDDDGPYNEVQTGPLLTQGEVGRLEPCEAVSWEEWWYPIHGTGGFSAANKNLAVNASAGASGLRVRIGATGSWSGARVKVVQSGKLLLDRECALEPAKPLDLTVANAEATSPFNVEIRAKGGEVLGTWRLPLDLPVRTPPEKKPEPQTASEWVQAGWQEFLFARFAEARKQFRKALEQDAKCPSAHLGVAYLALDADPAEAATEARQAVAVNPDLGLAHYVLAVAESRRDHPAEALDEAWKASLDPSVALAARGLIAQLLIQAQRFGDAVAALREPGPWQSDSLCRDRLAFALTQLGDRRQAEVLARQNLDVDPLDSVAHAFLPGGKSSAKAATGVAAWQETAVTGTTEPDWPWQYESLASLEMAVAKDPSDGRAALRLGHLLFHLGRHEAGRRMWQRAYELGTEPVIACRALGMAAKSLAGDLAAARSWLEKGNHADPADAIVARDLSKVLFELGDKTEVADGKKELVRQARGTLLGAMESGRSRSDFVALLARADNRLGDYAETARLLDSVRITVWEGAHEVHDLFEEAHLALGKARLEAGRAKEALAEFDRALEYPENLATGKLEETREAQINYLRGKALAAMGQRAAALEAWRNAADEPASDNARKEEARKLAKEELEKAGR
jgi:tetratricopeptide (TPR) repeat protein